MSATEAAGGFPGGEDVDRLLGVELLVLELAAGTLRAAFKAWEAFSRQPVTVLFRCEKTWSTLLRISDLIWLKLNSGRSARIRAMAPVTCGVAIDVPLPSAYPPPGTVLRMLTPGAPRSTLV